MAEKFDYAALLMEKARRSHNSFKEETFLTVNTIIEFSMCYVLRNTRTEFIVLLLLLRLRRNRHFSTVLKLLFENINSISLKGNFWFYFMLYASRIIEWYFQSDFLIKLKPSWGKKNKIYCILLHSTKSVS